MQHKHTLAAMYVTNIPLTGSTLQRILSADAVSPESSSCCTSLLQEGAGSVESHHSTSTLWRSLAGHWTSISSHFEAGMCRQIHRLSQVTSLTASVTASSVSGGAASGEEVVQGKPDIILNPRAKMIVATEISVCTYL